MDNNERKKCDTKDILWAFVLVLGLGTLGPWVNCPYTPTTLPSHFKIISRFLSNFFPRMAPQFFEYTNHQVIWQSPGTLPPTFIPSAWAVRFCSLCWVEGMGAKAKRKKKKFWYSAKARAGWPKRLKLVQATLWADFAVITSQLWSTVRAGGQFAPIPSLGLGTTFPLSTK